MEETKTVSRRKYTPRKKTLGRRRYTKRKYRIYKRPSNIISTKLHVSFPITSDNLTDKGTLAVNWFGVGAVGGTPTINGPTIPEHVQMCSRFRKWKFTYGILEWIRTDVVTLNPAGATNNASISACLIGSDSVSTYVATTASDDVYRSLTDFKEVPSS